MLIGYARVSTDDQNMDLQRDALASIGCERLFEDKSSGAKADRPGLKQAIDQLRDGDTLVVWRLDRLGRSLKDLIIRAEELNERGVGLKSIQESIDTNSSGGQLIFHMFGALAQFERSLIRERTQAGLQAARARGRKGGRPKSLARKQREHAANLYKAKQHTVKEICALVGIPALSRKALKRISTAIRKWKFQGWSGHTVEDIAQVLNPVVNGWVNYYGHFGRGELYRIKVLLEFALVRWARRKFKKLRRSYRKSTAYIGRLQKQQPALFVHWQLSHNG